MSIVVNGVELTEVIYAGVNLDIVKVKKGTAEAVTVFEKITQLATPQNVTADGTTVSWDTVENATSYAVLADGVSIGTVEAAAMPVKGDIITIDSKQYRVLKLNGTVAEVLAMYNSNSLQFGNSNIYEGSTADMYCNNTFYESLSTNVRENIKDKVIKQDSWTRVNSADSSTFAFTPSNVFGATNYYMKLVNADFGNNITRHCYCLSVQDIIDYLDGTTEMTFANTTLTSNNLRLLFCNNTTDTSTEVWLRSAESTQNNQIQRFSAWYGSIGYYPVDTTRQIRPAFQIDLSKVEWSK